MSPRSSTPPKTRRTPTSSRQAKRRPDDFLAKARAWVEPALEEALARIGQRQREDGPEEAHIVPERLEAAMRYVLLAPGKRLRPALVLGGARAVGASASDVLPAACAVEMIHAYSLVHDDLPMLDDDDFRRGLPACHKKFDEATALLAGDALLTEAFALLADARPLARGGPVSAARRVSAVWELARAAGAAGMVGGQVDDSIVLARRGHPDVRSVHRRKTGRLIQAAAALGSIAGGGNARQTERLRAYGRAVGLAFQLVDDALDGDGVAALEGKEAARQEALRWTEDALEHLEVFGRRADPLREVARAMVSRVE